MAVSQNGWQVAPALESFTLNGLTFRTRAGDVRAVLEYVARQFNARVERVITQSSFRTVAGNTGDTGSNHTSGTAIDLNGFRHPYEWGKGIRDQGFTAAQIAEVRHILAEVNGTAVISAGVVQWGYDYRLGWRDGMHFQIRPGKTAVDVAAARRRIASTVSNPISGGGGSVSTPTIPGAPAPLTKEWDEMATKQEVTDAVVDALTKWRAGVGGRNLYDLGNQTLTQLGALSSDVAAVKADVANVPYRTGVELRVDGRNIFDWFKQTRSEQAAGFAAVSGKTTATDTTGLAKAIADQLPDDLARKVADELANRLKG